jgi:MFS transporter, putative metabolite:H+ symporter
MSRSEMPPRQSSPAEHCSNAKNVSEAVSLKPIERNVVVDRLSARLDRLPSSAAIWKLVVLLGLGFFFELYDLLYTGNIAPGLVRAGILTPVTPGLFGTTGLAGFVAALFAGLFIGTIAGGFLADRYGRRAIFTWSLTWYTAANVIMAFQTTALGLDLWRFLSGLGIGLELVVIGTYLSELVPKGMRGRAFACCQAIGFTAVPVAAFLSYLLVPRDPWGLQGWRWIVLIGAHGAIFIWWIRRALPESPRWLALQGRLAEAEAVVAALEAKVASEHSWNLPTPEPACPVVRHEQIGDMWRQPYLPRSIMMIVFNVLQTVSFYGFLNWVPTLLIHQGITTINSLFYAWIIALGAPVGPLIGLVIADRFERKYVLVAVSLGSIACGLAFAEARNAIAIVLLGVGLTICNNMMSYTFHAYQQELFPTGIRARAVGFVYSWSRFSAIFTGFIIAFVLDHAGIVGVFVFIAGALLIALAVILVLGPKTRGRMLEEISR